MKRALALLLALLHAAPAEALTLVLYHPRPISTTTLGVREAHIQDTRAVRLVVSAILATGGEVLLVRGNGIATENVRLGQYVVNAGKAGAYAIPVDAIAAVGYERGTSSGYARLDSLTRAAHVTTGDTLSTTGGLRKPILWLGTNGPPMVSGGPLWTDATACTTGTDQNDKTNPNIGQINYQLGTTEGFYPHAYTSGWTLNATTPAGGLRKHVVGSDNTYDGLYAQQGKSCTWCDSTNYARADTVFMWERPMSHINGSKPIVFATFYGAGASYDSVSNANSNERPPAEGSTEMLFAALARLDSLSGGNVFGPKVLKKAITIDGGFVHGSNVPNMIGFYVGDSAGSFYPMLDSLAARNLPAVLGVNTDSVRFYPGELARWMRWPKLRFAPQTRAGLDSAAASGGASAQITRDPWGRWRVRSFVGDGSGLGADTSMASLGGSELARCDSIFGRERVSRFALPADDDWSPLNVRPGSGPANKLDSLFYAIGEMGYTGVRVNLQSPESNASGRGVARTNPRGYLQRQGYYTEPFGGHRIKLLGHNGYLRAGGTRQAFAWPDSTVPYADIYVPLIYPELERLFMGLYMDADRNHDNFRFDGSVYGAAWYTFKEQAYSVEDMTNPPVRAYVHRFNVADFSGMRNGMPVRNGWIVLKSADNAMRLTNRLAGRTVFAWAYPEDVEP